jgi:uncharacterized membrane protein
MDELYIPALILHIVTGGLALLTGVVNLVRKKGDRTHRTVGKVFVISMLASCFSAIFLSLHKGNMFLFIIGFFTIYLIGTGMRYLTTIRRRVKAKRVSASDWSLTFLLGLFSLALYYLSVTFLIRGQLFGVVTLSFAGLSSFMVYQDFIVLTGKSSAQNFGLLMHIQRMSGAFIASLTAFIVVNVTFLPGIVTWTLPSALVVPFIVVWVRKYRKEKKDKLESLELG